MRGCAAKSRENSTSSKDAGKRELIECNEDSVPAITPDDVARIDEGIVADERGDFATNEEVQAEFARWRRLRG
jgi:hypothetical protein